MHCCGKHSYFSLSFRKEPQASGLPGWTSARMGSLGCEGSLCLPVVGCFPCSKTQPVPVDVLPGGCDALFFSFVQSSLFLVLCAGFKDLNVFGLLFVVCFFPPNAAELHPPAVAFQLCREVFL